MVDRLTAGHPGSLALLGLAERVEVYSAPNTSACAPRDGQTDETARGDETLTPTKRIYSVEAVFYGIKPVLASGYIAALGYLRLLATRWG